MSRNIATEFIWILNMDGSGRTFFRWDSCRKWQNRRKRGEKNTEKMMEGQEKNRKRKIERERRIKTKKRRWMKKRKVNAWKYSNHFWHLTNKLSFSTTNNACNFIPQKHWLTQSNAMEMSTNQNAVDGIQRFYRVDFCQL